MTNTSESSTELVAIRLEAEKVLEDSYPGLFRLHSNLLAGQVDIKDGCCVIKLTVPCKGLVPYCDRNNLPSRLGKFKNWICSGWMEPCGKYECDTQKSFRFGSSVCPRPLSLFLPTDSPSCLMPSFGTLGGCVKFGTQIYGVTAGHVFSMKERIIDETYGAGTKLVRTMYPTGTEAVHGSAMSNLSQLLRKESCEGDYENLKRSGCQDPISKILKRLEYTTDKINENFCVVGEFIGGVCGKIDDQCGDVAVFTIPSVTDDIFSADPVKTVKDFGEIMEAIAFPNYLLNFSPDAADEIEKTEGWEEIREGTDDIHLFDQGANSEHPSKVLVTSKQLYLRGWFPKNAVGTENSGDDPIYKCIYGTSQDMNWNAGDSGTWFWRKDEKGSKRFIGMGIGRDRAYGCIILPMKTVLSIARQIILKYSINKI